MLNCITSLMYFLVTGEKFQFFLTEGFLLVQPLFFAMDCNFTERPKWKKKKPQIINQNSWIWVHLSLVLKMSHEKSSIVALLYELSPFISIAQYFSLYN